MEPLVSQMKTFLQIVLSEDDEAVSGAELRNVANLSGLSTMASGEVFTITDLPKSGDNPRASTVRAVANSEIDRLIEKIRHQKPDLVLLEGVALLDVAKALRLAFPDVRIVTDFHNVESALLAEKEAARLPRFLRFLAPLLSRRHVSASVAADREIAALSDLIWTCSEQDEDLVREFTNQSRTAVVPNPIPEWIRNAGEANHSHHNCVLFVGHLGYAPNKRAVRALCTQIMPLVRAEIPDAYLQVCGRRPNTRLQKQLAAAGARLAMNPSDLAPFYTSAAATALPLQEGGGTRIKAIEALSVGCPIVATSKAVAGLNLVPGIHYMPAETPGEFARCLVSLMQDKDSAASMIAAGKSYALANFAPHVRQQAIRNSLRNLFTEAGQDPTPGLS